MGDFSRRTTVGSQGVPAPARLNANDELVTTPWLIQMALEGRVFTAGTGLEEGGVTTETTLADVAATFALAAPPAGTLVIPIDFRAYYGTEGDGVQEIFLMYCQTDKSAYTGGTEMPALNLRGGGNPPAAQGKFSSTVTLDAIVAAEYVTLNQREHIADNYLTVESVKAGGQDESFGSDLFTFRHNFQQMGTPIILYNNSFISFHTNTATTGDTLNASATWVELPASAYGLA